MAVGALATKPADAQLREGEPARFLQRYIGLSPGQIEAARDGSVITRVLDAADPDEVAIFAIVAIDVPRATIAARVHEMASFLMTASRPAFGIFGSPATVNDARAFSAEKSDLDALRDCRPGHCNVKMPVPKFDEFRRSIDWSLPDAPARVNAIVRQTMVDYVEGYRRGGTAAMVEYGDQDAARRASDAFGSLLAESPYLYDYVPAFQGYLQGYPSVTLPGVTDAIYWATDRMSSLRPILSITHLSIYEPADAAITLISAKQLYASHYFIGAFTLTTLLDRPDAPNGRGSYYMVVQRMRFDHLPSGGFLNIRGRVIGKMNDALADELRQRKADLEAGR